jgi:hypothetical protein
MTLDERDSNTGRPSLISNPARFLSQLAVFRKFSEACENPRCEKRQPLWLFWQRRAEGIRLQGRWYCSPECFEHAARGEFQRLRSVPESGRRKAHRMPIGLLLLSRGVITEAQLKRALAMQREKGTGKIGRILRDIQAATEQDIVVGLAAQWGCPVYPVHGPEDLLQHSSLLPLTLLEAGRMLPVQHIPGQQMLYLAFVEGIDRNALYSVEQMLRLRTVPCIVPESAYLGAIEELRHVQNAQTTVFESPLEPREMARTTRSYAWQIGASDVWMVRSGRFIWVRLQNVQGPKDILFQTLTGGW